MSKNVTWAELTPDERAYLDTLARAKGEWVNMPVTLKLPNTEYQNLRDILGLIEMNAQDYTASCFVRERITPAGLAVWQQRDGAQAEPVLAALWQPASDDTQPDLGAALDDFRAAVAALEMEASFGTDGGVLMTERMVDVLEAGVAMLRARGVTQGAFGDAMTRRLMHTANG